MDLELCCRTWTCAAWGRSRDYICWWSRFGKFSNTHWLADLTRIFIIATFICFLCFPPAKSPKSFMRWRDDTVYTEKMKKTCGISGSVYYLLQTECPSVGANFTELVQDLTACVRNESDLNNLATFEVSHSNGNAFTKWEATKHIRCWDEWIPANELWQDPFGSFELAYRVCFCSVRGERSVLVTLWYGHQCFGPFTSLHRCICFQMGLRQASDVPCWGPLKPETLEVDVCMCPVCFQKTFQIKDSKCGVLHQDILYTASSAGYIPAPDALALDRPPPPPSLPCKPPVASYRPGSRPPWDGQQPLLTPAIKLKSYSLIPQLWSVQSIV